MTQLDQRTINDGLILGMQGENARFAVFDRDGKPAAGCVWANPESREMGTITDYRAMGYRIVQPKEVETLDGGTWKPASADFGVLFELDKKADRVTTKGSMVLMYAPPEVRHRLKAQQQALADQFSRKESAVQKLRGGASEDGSGQGAEIRMEEKTTTETLSL